VLAAVSDPVGQRSSRRNEEYALVGIEYRCGRLGSSIVFVDYTIGNTFDYVKFRVFNQSRPGVSISIGQKKMLELLAF